MHSLTHTDVLSLLPNREENAHKGDFGRILLLCGSLGYTGAGFLAAMGALRSGAGLVYLAVPESVYPILAGKLNEAIVLPLPDDQGAYSTRAIPEIAKLLPKMDAVLIGCGMGLTPGAEAVLSYLLKSAGCPVVVDADGITLLARNRQLLQERNGITILTPHEGEYTRLGYSIGEDRMASARAAACDLGCILLLKGHRTCITDGTREYRNTTGNPGMAVGGSGDLLAGILVSLLGQRIPPLEAAACAAYLHGAAGDVCAREIGQYGMLPTDMLAALPRLMK